MFCVEGHKPLDNFSLAVGDDADVSTHAQCGSYAYHGAITSHKYVVPCRDVGRYFSIKRNGEERLHLMSLCEVIIMGYVYNGDDSTGKCYAMFVY